MNIFCALLRVELVAIWGMLHKSETGHDIQRFKTRINFVSDTKEILDFHVPAE